MSRLSCRTLASITPIAIVLIAQAFLPEACWADAEKARVWFFSQGQLVSVYRAAPAGMSAAEAAVRALVAGPTQAEMADGIRSSIPAGVTISSLTITDSAAEIDMSSEVLAGLDEARSDGMLEQFLATLDDYPSIKDIRLTCNGRRLSSYLPPLTPVVPLPRTQAQAPAPGATGLSGHSVCIGPSHGYAYWNDDDNNPGGTPYWHFMRLQFCGLGDEVREDLNSIRLCRFLKQYLSQDGARVECPRQIDDDSDCCDPDTGLPWWQMGAMYWLRHIEAPSSVWANQSGNTGPITAVNRWEDDLRARPLWADYTNTDIYLACHTNSSSGTKIYRNGAMLHPEWVDASLNLSNQLVSNICGAIQSVYDATWGDGGVYNSDFNETRFPNQPTTLIELASHQNCTKDALYVTDDFFRSTAEWGVYRGICSYFGVTPTWDKYSCEYVGDTIPSAMMPGQSYPVTITLRNRGVSWFTSRGFRLGEPDGSDPFTSANRIDISGQVKPGQDYTFSVTLTAPSSPGFYTTEWQMVRDGYAAWFGPTVTRQIAVSETPLPYSPISIVLVPTGAGSVTGAGTYDNGTDCTLETTANPGYTFSKWTSDAAGDNQLSTANPYTFTVTTNATIYAQFTTNSYSLTATSCDNGSAGGSGTYQYGQSVTVTAIPNANYMFMNWRTGGCGGAVVSTNASYTFSMPPNDYTLYANFEPVVETVYFPVRATSTPPYAVQGCYALSPGYTGGTGYSTTNWYASTGAACTTDGQTAYHIRNYYQNTATAVTLDTSAAATHLTDTTGYYDVYEEHFGPTNNSTNLVVNLTLLANAMAISGDFVTGYTNWPTAGCTFRLLGRIRLSGQPKIKMSYRSGTLGSQTSNWYFTCMKFVRVLSYSFTTTVSPTGGGTVGAYSPNYTKFYSGQSVTVSATPNPGYHFVNWTDGGTPVSTNATYAFSMPGSDGALVANFQVDNPPTGTTNIPKISDIWALPNGATVYNVTGKTVTAVWSDGFWIGEADRSAGIKVLYSSSSACTIGDAIAAGKLVDVYGTLSTGSVRLLTATVVVTSAGTAIEPVMVTEKYTGGKQVNDSTPAVVDGKGIYSVGLLVRLAGTAGNAGADYFYLDDGSGLKDGVIAGMKILCGGLTPPSSGSKVVTGVVGIIDGKPVIYATDIANAAQK